MTKLNELKHALSLRWPEFGSQIQQDVDELTLTCPVETLIPVLVELRHNPVFQFNQLIDLCGVDYLTYGTSDWETDTACTQGFSRGVERQPESCVSGYQSRFAVVYHLLSTELNHRLRVKVSMNESNLVMPSICSIWRNANWYEREAFDLFGFLFEDHPDLRRILTDYGFIGHPFRKDFPLSGQVEMRYDAALKKVIYEAVEIEPRITVPKVIRHDNRYLSEQGRART
ncbi:MAG: NADH-quinone oxidoreductase subunit C [Legionella sp. 21-45-4]|nr:MAG: NADH-quinone oxidoreductase subunit C [Legionella sp. 21-45-4]